MDISYIMLYGGEVGVEIKGKKRVRKMSTERLARLIKRDHTKMSRREISEHLGKENVLKVSGDWEGDGFYLLRIMN